MNDLLFRLVVSLLAAMAGWVMVRHGLPAWRAWAADEEERYDRVLRRQLLMDIHPRTAVYLAAGAVLAAFLLGLAVLGSIIAGLILAALAYFVPRLVVTHLEEKRRQRLDSQLVDALTTMASAVRAGLNLVQAMELLVTNHVGPVKQEFGQVLREYSMGRDLNECLHAASNRIGSPLYRLTFTAIEMHRLRGGDTGESLDRIAESIRDIQRLEGKLDAMTAQGRMQAWAMAAMPLLFVGILYLIEPEGVTLLFTTTVGKLILLIIIALIVLGYLWIKRIMAVDI